MSDYLSWPARVGTDNLAFRTRRPRAVMYGPARGTQASIDMFGPSKYTADADQLANRGLFRFKGSGRYGRARMNGRRRIRRHRSSGMRIKGGRGGYFDNWFNFGTIGHQRDTGGASLSAGMGDYTVPGLGTVDNAIVGAGYGSAGIPQFAPHHSSGTFSKVEFLQSIYAPTTAGAFQNTVLPLNPGLQQTFPWLALVAPQFEEYEFLQLMFYWRPMVSDFNSGTGQVGEIVMVTQYNPSDPPFIDTLRAKSYDMAMSCKASLSMNHGVECDPTKNSGAPGKYVRVGPLTGDTDIKQYDLGNLNVIVTGTPSEYSGQLLGELWVAYTVQLRKPKLPVSTGDTILRDYFCNADIVTSLHDDANAFNAWPTRPIGYAEQNRINVPGEGIVITGTVDPSPQLTVAYTPPLWYTGDLNIVLTLHLRQVDLYLPGNFGKALNTPVGVVCTGNCVGIPDIDESTVLTVDSGGQLTGRTGITPYKQTNYYIGTTATDGILQCGTNTLNTQAHVRFEQDVSGVPRTVTFTLTPWESAAIHLIGWSLDASEYNSGFNSRTNTIGLVLADGSAVVNPYAQTKAISDF